MVVPSDDSSAAKFTLLRNAIASPCLPRSRAPRRWHQRPSFGLPPRRNLTIPLGLTRCVQLPIYMLHANMRIKAPVRLVLFFCITFYSYAFSDSSPMYGSQTYYPSSWGEGLKNRVLFTWAFVEMITWFWVFVTLREERRDFMTKQAQKRAAEEDMM